MSILVQEKNFEDYIALGESEAKTLYFSLTRGFVDDTRFGRQDSMRSA